MAGVVADERLVEDEVGLLEARLEIADDPLVGVLARAAAGHRSAAAKSSSVHFSSWTFGPAGGALRRRAEPAPAAAPGAPTRCPGFARSGRPAAALAIGSTTKGSGSQSIWIFSIASAAVSFVHGGHGEDRLALVERLVGQAALAERAGDDAFAEVGALDDRPADRRPSRIAFTPGIASGRARVDADAPWRAASGSGAAWRTACPRRGSPRRTSPPRDLRDEVRRRVVLSNQLGRLVVCHGQASVRISVCLFRDGRRHAFVDGHGPVEVPGDRRRGRTPGDPRSRTAVSRVPAVVLDDTKRAIGRSRRCEAITEKAPCPGRVFVPASPTARATFRSC